MLHELATERIKPRSQIIHQLFQNLRGSAKHVHTFDTGTTLSWSQRPRKLFGFSVRSSPFIRRPRFWSRQLREHHIISLSFH